MIGPVEHDQYRWCDYEAAMELLHWEGNREALRRFEEWLLGKKQEP